MFKKESYRSIKQKEMCVYVYETTMKIFDEPFTKVPEFYKVRQGRLKTWKVSIFEMRRT